MKQDKTTDPLLPKNHQNTDHRRDEKKGLNGGDEKQVSPRMVRPNKQKNAKKSSESLLPSDFRKIWVDADNTKKTVHALRTFFTPELTKPGTTIEFTAGALRYLVAFIGIAALVGHNSKNQDVFDVFLRKDVALVIGGLFCVSFVLETFGVQREYTHRH